MTTHVLLSAYTYGPGQGSEGANGWGLSRALADQGVRVTVLTTAGSAKTANAALTSEPNENLEIVEHPIPAWAWKLPSSQIRVYVLYLAWQYTALRVARDLVRTRNISIAHHMTWGSMQLGSQLHRLPIPLLFGPCGGGQVAPKSLRPFYFGRWAQEALRTFITRWLIPLVPFARATAKGAARVLVANPETGQLARRLGARDVKPANEIGLRPDQLLDAPRESATNGSGPLKLIWVGRFMPRKGLPLALDAMQKINADVHLTICGYGFQEPHVQSWIDERDLGDKVTFRGKVPYEEMVAAYAAADALLFTSLRDSTGSQLLEAMGQGLAIVCLNHHGAAYWVPDDAGLKVDVVGPDTDSAVAHALDTLAASPARLHAMQTAAWNFAQTQRWEAKSADFAEHYSQLISQHLEV